MSMSAETVFSVLLGGLISGLVTWGVAERYFRKQDVRAEQVFDMLVRMVQRLTQAIESEAQTYLRIERVGKGRIVDVKVMLFQGFAPGITVTTPDTRNNTESAPGQDA
jgi:hypothetical protein